MGGEEGKGGGKKQRRLKLKGKKTRENSNGESHCVLGGVELFERERGG